jgi:phage-related protein
MWRVEILDHRVEAELESLPADIKAHLARIVELIEAQGLEHIREPYIKHLEGKLWEMRMKGKDAIARAIYVTKQGKRIVIVHAFVKKRQETPRRALEIARQRSKEVLK